MSMPVLCLQRGDIQRSYRKQTARIRILESLTQIGAHVEHAVWQEVDLRHLDGDGLAVEQDGLTAPVELLSHAGSKLKWHIGLGGSRTLSHAHFAASRHRSGSSTPPD
jgi:hypothetical protein